MTERGLKTKYRIPSNDCEVQCLKNNIGSEDNGAIKQAKFSQGVLLQAPSVSARSITITLSGCDYRSLTAHIITPEHKTSNHSHNLGDRP
jgi:hypothetical protein